MPDRVYPSAPQGLDKEPIKKNQGIKGTTEIEVTTDKDETNTSDTPLMVNRNSPSKKAQASNGLASLQDKGTEKNPIPRSPLPFTEGKVPESQNDSLEINPGAPVNVSAFDREIKLPCWPGDFRNMTGYEFGYATREILYVLDYGRALGRPPELKGDLEEMLQYEDLPVSDDNYNLIRQWFESVSKQLASVG